MRRAWALSLLLHGALLALVLGRTPAPLPPPDPPLVVEVDLAAPPEPEETAAPERAETAPLPERVPAAPPPEPKPAPLPDAPAETDRPDPPEPQPEEATAEPQAEPEESAPAPAPAPPPEPSPATPPEPAVRELADAAPAESPRIRPPRPRPARLAQARARTPPVPRPRPARLAQSPPSQPDAKGDGPPLERADVTSPDPLDALLRSVEQVDRRLQDQKRQQGRGERAEGRPEEGADAPAEADAGAVSLAELQRMVEEQVYRCWILPVGARGVRGLNVLVRFSVAPDGTVRRAEVVDRERLARDPLFRIVAESAIRAVRRCSPLQLPKERYAQWRAIEMNFDLEKALSG